MLKRIILFWWTLLSHYKRHPAQGVFLLLGLSLGVAMLLATLMVSTAAKEAFNQAQQTLGGQAVAHIVPSDGHATLAEQLYRDLRLNGVSHILPIVEGRIETKQGYLSLRGVDVFPLMNHSSDEANRQLNNMENIRSQMDQAQEANPENLDYGLLRFSYPPYLFLVSSSYARMQGLQNGQTIILASGQELPPVRVLDDSEGLGYFLLCDIRCAQKYLGLQSRLTSIVINTLEPEDINIIEQISGQNASLIMADKNVKNPAFTEAFLLNLKAIGFLAFLVGCFIAFNAVRFSVLQRTQTVKQMRLCGATANEIALALFLELCTWAVLASLSGGILAWTLASVLLPSIGMTLDQLFFNDNILLLGQIQDWWLMAILTSLLATFIATIFPLTRLAWQKPLSDKHTDLSHFSYLWISLPLLLLGSVLAFGPTVFDRSQWLGLIITAFWFVGGALLVPSVLGFFYHLACRINYFHSYPSVHWLLNDGRTDQQRQGTAMIVFAIAMAASIAVVTMVSSFRQAFSDYLDVTLSESIYLSVDDASFKKIDVFLSEHEGVEYHYPFYMNHASINLESGMVRGVTDSSLRQSSFILEQHTYSELDSLWQAFHERKGILVNQALALSYQLKPGDIVSVVINKEVLDVEVLGVYFSYGSLVNAFAMDQQWLLSIWPDLHTNRIGVYAKDDAHVEKILLDLTEKFQLGSHHYVLPKSIKILAFSIFQQTFHATQLLSFVIMLIAAIGIFCSCYTTQMDKQAQLSLVRILGVSGKKMMGLALVQLLINVLMTCLIALPLGMLVAWASVQVVLRYSFGWYFELNINTQELVLLLLLGVTIICLGALVPLYISAKRSTAKCLTLAG